jgi:hypothetical protein
MFSSLRVALIGAVLTLLVHTPTASAGPIPWSYQGTIEAINSGPYVQFGVEDQPWFDPATGGAVVTPYQILGRIDATFSGTASGQATIHAAAYDVTRLEAFPIDDEWALNRPNRFQVRVTILDETSDQARDLVYVGQGSSSGFFLSGTGVVNLSLESRMDVFELGKYRYSVEARVRDSESAAHIELDVGVVRHNPEPGTLALAGIGLFGLGILRRFRKG